MTKFYTGVGSRETPPQILKIMAQLAAVLAADGWILRSGAADGADSAFEQGAGSKTEIFIPWPKFNGHNSQRYPSARAMEIAAAIHPAWERCSQGARKLHARNIHQVLGPELNRPSDALICWTRNGELVGGTATAIRLAMRNNIPVYNLGNPNCTPQYIIGELTNA